jgi:hypothetical protein
MTSGGTSPLGALNACGLHKPLEQRVDGKFFSPVGCRLRVGFTGWKWTDAGSLLVAQWIAKPGWGERSPYKDIPFFYSSTPGGAGPYRRGQVFDIGPKSEQICLGIADLTDTFPDPWLLAKATAAQAQALQRLLTVIYDWRPEE